MNFLEGKTFEEMKSNVMCYHAVVHNIMIIGEAANLLTKDFREQHPDVPWRDIIDMMLSTIIEKSGFTSESTFFRTFKSVTGQSPREWLTQDNA